MDFVIDFFSHNTQVIFLMQESVLCLTEKIGQGTKSLITSDENDDGKNCKKSELELTTESITLLFYQIEPLKNGISLILPSSIARSS